MIATYGLPLVPPWVVERHQVGAFPSSVEQRLTSVEPRLAFPSAPAFNVLRPSVVDSPSTLLGLFPLDATVMAASCSRNRDF